MGKCSTCAQKADSLRQELLGKLGVVQGTCSDLQNALLHYFLSCGINKEEAGELILDNPESNRGMDRRTRDRNDEGHTYASKPSVGCLIVNWGNFVRGHKYTLPAVYAEFFNERDSAGLGPMVQSLARSTTSHLILLNEAPELTDGENAYLGDNGWLAHQNNAKDLAVTVRANFIGAYINQIAGSNYRMTARKYLPMSYMICEVCFGKCPDQKEIGIPKPS